jgi:hypothetical protein
MVLAHAGHWAVQLLYLAPVLIIAVDAGATGDLGRCRSRLLGDEAHDRCDVGTAPRPTRAASARAAAATGRTAQAARC